MIRWLLMMPSDCDQHCFPPTLESSLHSATEPLRSHKKGGVLNTVFKSSMYFTEGHRDLPLEELGRPIASRGLIGPNASRRGLYQI